VLYAPERFCVQIQTLVRETHPTKRRRVFRRLVYLKMKIVLNGEQRDVEDGITLAALLQQLQLEPRNVAIEVNMDLVPRTHHAECALNEGDRVEIVTLVGGG